MWLVEERELKNMQTLVQKFDGDSAGKAVGATSSSQARQRQEKKSRKATMNKESAEKAAMDMFS